MVKFLLAMTAAFFVAILTSYSSFYFITFTIIFFFGLTAVEALIQIIDYLNNKK